jgi:hypothetical protein
MYPVMKWIDESHINLYMNGRTRNIVHYRRKDGFQLLHFLQPIDEEGEDPSSDLNSLLGEKNPSKTLIALMRTFKFVYSRFFFFFLLM